ncbi:hypothetical protein QJS04_geneDACA023741 [Acorus gramineus]|uniref:Glycosylphosphatidylinositol anchor attachment 1 protein n=1 Tax=Acorus gramineus TaxID=55184 RepID=A0AAV9BR74_ACOGR|nr:hypothetical protein QJS04_geneDACA023741 [Acorus gramineus]
MATAHPPKKKPRLLVRLGTFLVSHSVSVSVLCCLAGLLTLLLLPVLAKNTYVSENALMPGPYSPLELPRLIAQHMADVGAEVYHHKFYPQIDQFHPLHFFSCMSNGGMVLHNNSCVLAGINSVGIVRASRGDGKESIILVTPYNSEKLEVSDALSLGLGYSMFTHLSRVSWLAKDIVWLAADSQYGEYGSIAAWLKDYHNPTYTDYPEKHDNEMCSQTNLYDSRDKKNDFNIFRRAGTMAVALVLRVVDSLEDSNTDTLTIYSEASNGQMPNLDLINIVHFLAIHRQGLRVKIEKVGSLLNSVWLNFVGELVEWTGKLAARLNPQWRFGIPAAEYVDGTATLASSLYYQALGVPTGSHGAFRDYQVDAITLEFSPRTSSYKDIGQSAFLLRGGRLIEGVIRSINNLLEKFHQSFFLYLLSAPNKFVSVGVYMISFALLIAPLPISAAALFSGPNTSETWQWIHSARVVFTVYLWAVIVSLLPCPISNFPYMTSMTCTLAWVGLSTFILFILFKVITYPSNARRIDEWKVLKAVMIAAAMIGLGLMSIINYAAAQIGGLILVPMCLIVRPLKKAVLFFTGTVLLGIVAFPLSAMMILKGWFNGFDGVSIGDFWDWTESLWVWNSATYLYLVLVHLPCWVLYLHVLLYP